MGDIQNETVALAFVSSLDPVSLLVVVPLLILGVFVGAEVARRLLLPVLTALLALVAKRSGGRLKGPPDEE